MQERMSRRTFVLSVNCYSLLYSRRRFSHQYPPNVTWFPIETRALRVRCKLRHHKLAEKSATLDLM
jgi:hypothetical protein